jgi:hypothetical protein
VDIRQQEAGKLPEACASYKDLDPDNYIYGFVISRKADESIVSYKKIWQARTLQQGKVIHHPYPRSSG